MRNKSPEGTAESLSRISVVPLGLLQFWAVDPALKCWAIFILSLRDERRVDYAFSAASAPTPAVTAAGCFLPDGYRNKTSASVINDAYIGTPNSVL